MVQVPSKPVTDPPVNPFGVQVTGGIPLCCAWGPSALTASSGMPVLREAQPRESHSAQPLLSVAQRASSQNGRALEFL